MNKLLLPLLGALALAACAVGPDYRTPNTPPAAVKNAAGPEFITQTPEAEWWQEFADPELEALERRALAANLDLEMAYDRGEGGAPFAGGGELDYAPHGAARCRLLQRR